MTHDPKPILFDGFEKAFVGMLRRYGQSVPIAIYDYNKCMDILMDRDGMEEDEAVEWLEVNTLGAYLGESTPAMLFRCSLRELGEECEIDIPLDNDERDPGDEHQIDDLTIEQRESLEDALDKFAEHFVKYVREVDPKLFLRAKQYAADCSGNDMIEFVIDDIPKPKKEEDKDES
jgi:hypothetical protein